MRRWLSACLLLACCVAATTSAQDRDTQRVEAMKILLSDPKFVESLEKIRATASLPSDVARARETQTVTKCQVPVPADAGTTDIRALIEKTQIELNALVTFEGQTYQCVEVFGRSQESQGAGQIARRGVGLVKVPTVAR